MKLDVISSVPRHNKLTKTSDKSTKAKILRKHIIYLVLADKTQIHINVQAESKAVYWKKINLEGKTFAFIACQVKCGQMDSGWKFT